MPILLDIYREYDIKTTFYFTGYISKLFPEIIRMVVQDGHEVASHGKSHVHKDGFDVIPFDKQKKHLEYTKKLLEDISGQEVISFRAPALRVNKHTARALIETGHKIDSSIASQRFDFFLSFGGRNKLKWLTSPRLPYKVDINNIFKKGKSDLIEVPLSALFIPYVGTTMRIFPWITVLQRLGIHFENKINKKPVVFDIHPNEFIDESDEIRIINKRTKNPFNYFLKDWVRSKLKVKNLGKGAIPLYKKEIEFFKKRGYRFATVKQYCEEVGLI
ncbi:MAG: polysaccharide deacetylase family protein [Candidatus Lokiarchaeota archaeon]|nr:polysaccharide deacetylase family protein [Candidatus Lokiarchaeota archaeon]